MKSFMFLTRRLCYSPHWNCLVPQLHQIQYLKIYASNIQSRQWRCLPEQSRDTGNLCSELLTKVNLEPSLNARQFALPLPRRRCLWQRLGELRRHHHY